MLFEVSPLVFSAMSSTKSGLEMRLRGKWNHPVPSRIAKWPELSFKVTLAYFGAVLYCPIFVEDGKNIFSRNLFLDWLELSKEINDY